MSVINVRTARQPSPGRSSRLITIWWLTTKLDVNGSAHSLNGQGDGPVEAFVAALVSEFGSSVGGDFDVLDYAEHAIGQGSDARAVAYIETVDANGNIRWGIGTDPNITTASLRAVLAGFERQRR